jgi:uncharacterized membrane-anchored protein
VALFGPGAGSGAQETAEGLSAAAICDYALQLVNIVMEGAAQAWSGVNPTHAAGLAAQVVIFLV